MSQRLRDASRESDEMNEDENGVKEQNEGDSNSESVNVEEITSNEGSRKDDEEGESNDLKGESDDEKRENDDKQTESYGGVTESGDDGRESDDEESEGYGGATESDDDERESDDEESGDDDTNRKLAQGARESDDEESEGYGGVTESDDDERESDDEESGDDDTNRKLAQGARESDGKKENDDVENTVVAGEVEGRTGFLIGAEKFEYRVPPAGRRMRVGIGNVASEQVLEMNQGPRSLPFFPPEDDRGSSRQHHKRSSRRRRHDIFPDESYLEYKSLSHSFASGYYNGYHREEEQFQTLSPQLLVDVLIKCPDYCSTLLYFVEKFDFRPSHIRKIVSKNSHVFVLDKEAIILQPKIELCSSHLSLNGCRLRLECGNIHVCPRFITSHCNEENCLFGHKFKTNHNLRSLRNYYLDHLSSSSLKQFFRSSASTESQGLIEICKDYNKGKCLQKNCLALHICSDYIANRLACTNRQCQLNHNLLSSETRWLLGRHGIDTNEAPRDIFAVLLEINPAIGETEKSDTETGCHSASNNSLPLPAVPVSGEEESADNNDSIAVSVSTTALSDSSAQDLIAAIRNIPPDTNTDSDNVTVPQPSSVVCNSDINNSSAIITQVPNNFVPRVPCTKELKVNIPSLWSHHLEGDVRVAEICYDSVVGSCPREQHSCARLHSTRHFHWQVSEENDSWLNLQPFQVMFLERSFCNPALDSVSLPPLKKSELEPSKGFLLLLMGEDVWTVNFQGMVLLNSDETRILYLRRLCTEIIPGITINPSIYHWFVCDEDGVWTEYGENEDCKEDEYINSEVLECQYMINPNAYAQFTLSDGEYILDFNTMTQTSLSTQEVHHVRRRPKPHLQEMTRLFHVLEDSDSDEDE